MLEAFTTSFDVLCQLFDAFTCLTALSLDWNVSIFFVSLDQNVGKTD